ncbi:MAG: hypothetical protein WBH97_06865 [Rectinemataceae bacterium]
MHVVTRADVFGLIHPSLDVHTLGIISVTQLLEECGIPAFLGDSAIGAELAALGQGGTGRELRAWILGRRISVLGFSYRLDPGDAVRLYGDLCAFLDRTALRASKGGPVKALYFAGLPGACDTVMERFPLTAGVFRGDESPGETLDILGISRSAISNDLSSGLRYDEERLRFGEEIAGERRYLDLQPVDRSGSPRYGMKGERLEDRVDYGIAQGLSPLMRAHVGPYLSDRREAVSLFLDWTGKLASSGFLDVLSIGSSQLTQERFGEDWKDAMNGGGVPLNSREEFRKVWLSARPMLVRIYAGTSRVTELASIYEEDMDIAWHALSLWWFSKLDGRGPMGVAQNLDAHFRTMRFIASTGKPMEPNVPHHFAFRGTDDLGYVLSGYVAAQAAKASGIRTLVLQIMLNTPKYTWGIQDLAKARALLRLVRSLEGPGFRVLLQPRGGLDYFSPDQDRARAQLAAVTALMDDIEAHDETSPQIIHVVSYSEGVALADPDIVDESVRITRHALSEYRRLRRAGLVDDMTADPEVALREEELLGEARTMISAMERAIPNPWTPGGLYAMLASGFFPLPWLTELREEFPAAAGQATHFVRGAVKSVDESGKPLTAAERLPSILANLAAMGFRAERPGMVEPESGEEA